MSWIDTIKINIPEHLSFLETELDNAMTQHLLTEEEAHGAALAAAIATGDTGLSFEISMNGPLFKSYLREVASQAAVCAAAQSTYHTYLYNDRINNALLPATQAFRPSTENERMFYIFTLASAVVLGNQNTTGIAAAMLKDYHDLTHEQIRDIVTIASVIGAMFYAAI